MPEPRRTPILLIILASYLMLVLDISIVITALPKMRETLGFSTTGLSWVENGYTLAFGGLLLLGARAGDLLGRRRVFIAGIGIFAVASLACGLAISAAVLVIARAVQGIGAAIAAPATLALLTANFPEGRERTRALACYGAVAGGGTAVGLVLGGILTEWLSWRSGMFINIPIGASLIVAARRHVPETPRHAGRFDLAGAATATLGMTSLVYGIVRSTQVGWTDRLTLAAVVAGSALLMLFALNEARAKQPITPLRLFASGERTGAYLARFLFIGANFSFLFFCTLFLQGTRHAGPLVAGLAFLPVAIPSFLTGVALPPIAHRFGNAQVLAVAVTLALTGMAWLSRLSADSPYLTGIALPMLLIGVGQGAAFGPLTAAGVAGAPNDDAGAAAGLVNVAHQLGASLGLSILVTVFAAAGSAGQNAGELLAHRAAAGLTGGTVMLALALLLVAGLIIPAERRRRANHGAVSSSSSERTLAPARLLPLTSAGARDQCR
jgi:EmrB/QacA subfamily drug resistance transporter